MFDPTLGLFALLLAAFALAGVLVTFLGAAPQLRGLAQALRLSRARRRLLAGVGLASVAGAAFAVAAGGPGALAWWWLAALLGAGLHWAEARLGLGAGDMFEGTGRFGHALKYMSAGAGVAAALAAGALLHAQQGAELLRDGLGLAGWAAGPLLAALLLGVLLLARRSRRPAADPALPGAGALAIAALVVFIGLAVAALVAAPGAFGAGLTAMVAGALSGEAALAGLLAAAAQAVFWSIFAAGPGLGAAQASACEPPEPVVTVAPLAAVIATLAGLLVLASGDPRAPLLASEPGQQGGPPGLVALERHLGVGLQPSDYGQTIVLAPDLGLEPGKRYEVVLRADPRGHKAGQLLVDDNMVAVPAWAVAADVDAVILRDKDPARAANPGFDVRIACTREHVKTRVGEFYTLRPRDPNININQLMRARGLSGPHVELRDYHFVASVRPAVALDKNETQLLLYEEPRPADAAPDPALRELIALGYAGPYLDPGGATEAPPLALRVAPPSSSGLAFTPAPDQRVHLRLDAPARGLELGFVNRLGELEVPPWDFLAGATVAVLRHRDDPRLDVHVPVVPRLAFGRLRFTSADPALAFAALAEALPDHSPPHLLSPSFRFAAETRASTRAALADIPAEPVLIPLHPAPRPRGNPGYGLYEPHPIEVLLTGMEGPVRDQSGAAQVLPAQAARLGRAGAGASALALAAMVLAGLVFWLRRGQQWLVRLGGGEFGLTLVFFACVVVGPACDPAALLRLAVPAVGLCAVFGLTAVLIHAPRLWRWR